MQRKKVKLFTGIIAKNDPDLLDRLKLALQQSFSAIELESSTVRFDYTNYYEKEMGENLVRFWVGYKVLVFPDELPEIKKQAMVLEKGFATETGTRKVNIDPGYLELSKVVLASTKDYSHRVYLKDGIYAELEYRFINGKYEPLPWTYPDYKDTPAIEFFHKLRQILKSQLKE